ncbi:putative hydro-lyase [Collimonas silvisoli]|uniref:putative hydro-lyase n=1 Tax=Collimonas silvisoli TaxID=2825884 RepID=UPI001B8CED44|nr:putative hydro-lyase [Collimonas silvisoli]
MTPFEFRSKVRNGQFREPTAGHCGDFAQANLAILPKAYADDFLNFCSLNPKSCPLLGVGGLGKWDLARIGSNIDIRSDVPAYYIYRDGKLAEERASLHDVWQSDFVVFAIGCSFSFEQMLIKDGIPLRHIEQQKNVAMYRTNIKNKAVGPFGGNMVVSMRPMTAENAIKAIQLTARFPAIHGAPIHIGNPMEIGIEDIGQPDFGDAITILPNELPVFWACGVTPQEAIRAAGLSIAITHKPGYMLITDIPNSTLECPVGTYN